MDRSKNSGGRISWWLPEARQFSYFVVERNVWDSIKGWKDVWVKADGDRGPKGVGQSRAVGGGGGSIKRVVRRGGRGTESRKAAFQLPTNWRSQTRRAQLWYMEYSIHDELSSRLMERCMQVSILNLCRKLSEKREKAITISSINQPINQSEAGWKTKWTMWATIELRCGDGEGGQTLTEDAYRESSRDEGSEVNRSWCGYSKGEQCQLYL
ncbi:uncharacterized protein PGTG_11103 [Puccinia graminis f. sp. tritici CRL 75-36-700-3]|uniref:Uncharacterized protein n=1 Tax=Puccinia graminis f. sp. tritici (strain CRL 75-36-700-3 / race SCCL) TaxID=418459 RepID=E3KND8_PUCGT|nr:uncharacterized protein PGTG_11103 [Puccinia graminis f. sp. tritici CRL 75-36-700-3]EFP85774.1 hypothetical protein PGTG_11103 [Puccinia graminis f. sp. tritici CRL 75-36-700-3]